LVPRLAGKKFARIDQGVLGLNAGRYSMRNNWFDVLGHESTTLGQTIEISVPGTAKVHFAGTRSRIAAAVAATFDRGILIRFF